jgi:hypothetical protein
VEGSLPGETVEEGIPVMRTPLPSSFIGRRFRSSVESSGRVAELHHAQGHELRSALAYSPTVRPRTCRAFHYKLYRLLSAIGIENSSASTGRMAAWFRRKRGGPQFGIDA